MNADTDQVSTKAETTWPCRNISPYCEGTLIHPTASDGLCLSCYSRASRTRQVCYRDENGWYRFPLSQPRPRPQLPALIDNATTDKWWESAKIATQPQTAEELLLGYKEAPLRSVRRQQARLMKAKR